MILKNVKCIWLKYFPKFKKKEKKKKDFFSLCDKQFTKIMGFVFCIHENQLEKKNQRE